MQMKRLPAFLAIVIAGCNGAPAQTNDGTNAVAGALAQQAAPAQLGASESALINIGSFFHDPAAVMLRTD